MFKSLPEDISPILQWSWDQFEPYFRDLAERPLRADQVDTFLRDWTRLSERVDERGGRFYLATTLNTRDEEAEAGYETYLDEIYPAAEKAEQTLKEKLLASGLEPAGFELPLRKMRTQAALFREANLPLQTEESKLIIAFNKIIGAQAVQWEGQETTISQLGPVFQDPDRARREKAWRLAAERRLADREAINKLWQRFLSLRQQQAANAGFEDYRAFRWQQLLRFDYTPADCLRFHQAIEEVVVPATRRLYEKHRQRQGVASLRPWDMSLIEPAQFSVDPLGRPPLRPFSDVRELEAKASAIFHRVDPQLGKYFDILREEGFLDLENRKNKAPGAFCYSLPATKRPFLFANAVGLHANVQTVLHEAGHAFHFFERSRLPYYQQRRSPMEFNEVASMAMELLAAPYLVAEEGGFYSEAEAARARIELLEENMLFWPYMAVVDAFQHWVYESPAEAMDPAHCDAQWSALWQRFMVGVDWSGLEQEMTTGWQRKRHIHRSPFYYIEYGLAQMGAAQVWAKALEDQAGAVDNYRRALALGGTVSLPELYATAGAKLAFDADTLGQVVALMEKTVSVLEEQGE